MPPSFVRIPFIHHSVMSRWRHPLLFISTSTPVLISLVIVISWIVIIAVPSEVNKICLKSITNHYEKYFNMFVTNTNTSSFLLTHFFFLVLGHHHIPGAFSWVVPNHLCNDLHDIHHSAHISCKEIITILAGRIPGCKRMC